MRASGGRTRTERVAGISNVPYLDKFRGLLVSYFDAKIVAQRGPSRSVLYVKMMNTIYRKYDVTINVYSTDRITVQASPLLMEEEFTHVSDEVMRLARESVSIISELSVPTVQRANKVLNYATELDVQDEINRMVAVFLCDIVLDLLLTEKLRSIGIMDRRLLESESIPNKIRALEDRRIPVYRKDEALRLRIMRNKIAHGGELVTSEEAEWAQELTKDLFNYI